MRIALIYPPPWKIAAPGEPADTHGDGPPTGYRDGDPRKGSPGWSIARATRS